MRMAYFMDAKLETSGAEKPQIEVRHRKKLSKHISVGGSVASQITHNAWALRAAGLGRLRRRFCALRARCTPPAAAAFSSPLRKNCRGRRRFRSGDPSGRPGQTRADQGRPRQTR